MLCCGRVCPHGAGGERSWITTSQRFPYHFTSETNSAWQSCTPSPPTSLHHPTFLQSFTLPTIFPGAIPYNSAVHKEQSLGFAHIKRDCPVCTTGYEICTLKITNENSTPMKNQNVIAQLFTQTLEFTINNLNQ